MKGIRELLLVFGVSGVLFAAGASVIRRMSAREKQTVCASHLKEVALMGVQYQNDHDGYFPPMIVRGRKWEYWPQFVKIYARDLIHFSCPADELRGAGAFENDSMLPQTYQLQQVSYGMNYFLSDSGESFMKNWPCNIGKVVNPSYVIYFGDSRTWQLRPTTHCWERDYYPIHENTSSNFVMLDGHVENHTQATLGIVDAKEGWKRDRVRWVNWAK